MCFAEFNLWCDSRPPSRGGVNRAAGCLGLQTLVETHVKLPRAHFLPSVSLSVTQERGHAQFPRNHPNFPSIIRSHYIPPPPGPTPPPPPSPPPPPPPDPPTNPPPPPPHTVAMCAPAPLSSWLPAAPSRFFFLHFFAGALKAGAARQGTKRVVQGTCSQTWMANQLKSRWDYQDNGSGFMGHLWAFWPVCHRVEKSKLPSTLANVLERDTESLPGLGLLFCSWH